MEGERAWWRLLMAMAWLAVAACALLLCTQPLLLCSLLRRFARFLCYFPRLFRLRKRRLRPPWRDLNRFIWTRRRNPLRIPRRRPLSLLPLCILVFAIRLSNSASQPPPSRDSDYIRRCIASAAIFTLCKIAVRWVWSCRGRRWRRRPLPFVCGFFGGTAFHHLPTTLRDLRHSRALALLLLLAMDVERHPGPDTQSAKGCFFTAGLRKNHVVVGVGPGAPSPTTAPSLDQVRSYLRLCEDTKSPATLHIRCSYPSASVAKPPPSQALQRTSSRNRKATGMRTARLSATPLAKEADANRKRAARLSTTPLAREADSNRKRAARLSTTPLAREADSNRKRAARLSTTPLAREADSNRKRIARLSTSPLAKKADSNRKRAARMSTTPSARNRNADRMRAARLSTTPLAREADSNRKRTARQFTTPLAREADSNRKRTARQFTTSLARKADSNRKRTARQFTTASLRNREALRKAAARLSARLQLTTPHSYSVDAQRYRQLRTKHINIASCNHAIHNLVFAKMRWTTLKRLSLGGVDYQQWKIAAKRRANAKQYLLMGMRGAGVGQRASGAAGGGGGFKAVPWSNKKTAAEKRKETAQGLHASRQNLVAFKALGPRAALPHSHLTPEEHRQIVRNQCTLEVARVELDRRKKAALVRLRKHIAKLVEACDEECAKNGAPPQPDLAPIFTEGQALHCYRQEVPLTRRPVSFYQSLTTFQLTAGAGGDGALEVGGEDVQGGDGEDPDVAAAEEGGQGGGAGKTDLYRLCDDNCSLPEGWPDKLLSILRRLTSSTYSSYLQLGKVVETLVALEHCEACESREGRDTSVLARVSGDGCHPVEQCTDALRWLRWIIAPHFTKVRTLLRQLYKFREDIHTLCKIEFYMDHGELEELLQVIGQSKGNSLPTASSSTLPPLSTVSEDTIQNTLGILFNKFHEEMKDMRNKQCDVCEERKSAGELQRAEAVAGRKRRRDDDEELDPQGSPLIDTRTDSRLLLPRPYLIFMGLEKCRICKPCFAKLRTTPGRVLKDGEAEEYHRFLTRVRQQSQRSGPPDGTLPGVTGDFRLPHFPRLSIFNGCVLDPLPAPIKAVIAKGCFHTNMIKLVKAFFSVTYLRPAGNAGLGGMPALKGHSIYFPLSPSANTEYAQNICSLPSLTWETLILQGTKATKKQIFHALIAKEAVSAAIDWLINHNWDYRNVSNAWSASRLAEMTAEAMVAAGLEAEAADGDSEDEAEAAAPDDALYPRKRLRIRVVEDEDEEDGDSAPPQPPQPPNLNHLGSARILPLSASAQIQRSVAMAKTDIQVFENTRVEAEPLSAWDPKMESAPFPELYPTGRFGFNEGRPSWMNVNESEFARHQLNRLDPRFAESKEYLFAQTSRKVLRKVGSGVFFMTHTRSWSKSGTLPTVSDVLRLAIPHPRPLHRPPSSFRDLQSVASDQLEGRIDSVLRSVPFSPGYWSIQRQRLEALVDYEGPPSVFLTLSNAEYEDKALISFLGSLPSHIDDLNDMSISSLTQLNPMAVSEHYTKKTKLILKLVWGGGTRERRTPWTTSSTKWGCQSPCLPRPSGTQVEWKPYSARAPRESAFGDVDTGEEGGGGKDDDDEIPLAFRGRGLLGHVSNFVIRREYQGRGKAHFHILLWTPECPTVKADMSEEEKKQVEDYVTSIASVTLPDPKQSPRLYELVRTFQTHACRSTCKTGRSVKRKKADGETTLQWIPVPCRYGFPKDPSPCFVLLDPDSAVKNMMKEGCTHELYLLHRGPDEIFINPFHPVILLLLGANMDIKVIRDWDGKIAYYLTKYVTKNDKAGKGSEVWEAARKLDPAASLTSKLYSVALSVLKTQELGQEAAADFLNSVPLFTLSATTSYLSVAPRAKRRHVLKGSKAQLEEMESSGRGGDCPVHLGFWDSTVPFRPRELEETCAWELQEHFERLSPAKYEERLQSYEARLQAAETAGRAPPDPLEAYRSLPTPDDRDFYLIRRKTPKITYTRTFRAETKEQGEETACCLLMLFKPYRDEDTLRGDHRSFVQALETEKPHLHRLHEWERRTTKRQKLGEALRQLRMEAEAELAADAESPEQAADGDVPQQSSLGAQRVPVGDELHSVVSSLNSDQHTVFCKVVDQLRHQRIHEAECRESLLPPAQQRCSWSLCSAHPRPLRQVVLGGAGTGKSHLIQAVTGQANRDALLPPALLVHPVGSAEDQALCDEQVEAVREALEQPLQDVARLTAPTGVAAWLIGGSTIHSTFRVPVITSRDSAPSAPELSGLALKTKKAEFRRTTIVIMDEVSMVSNAMLLFVSRQLSLITGKDDDWFGGMNMLLLGDLSQLQPVKAEGPYRPVIGDVYGTQVRREVDVWGQFHVHFLTQSMRAAEDPAFVSILTSVSQGNGSDDVLDALNARRIFLSHDGSQPTIDPKHPHFVQQCCPKETPVWKQEDYMSEAELCDAAARWAFEWEKANPGRELTVLAPRVDQCRQISSLALRLRGIPFTKILAQDELVRGFGGSKAEQTARKTKTPVDAKTEDTGGLEAELELGPGAKVMVRKNMDDSKGLVNGAVGTVTKLERSVDGRRVEFVHVKLKATGGEHKIGRVSVLFKAHKSSAQQFSRSQFPLISAYCITVHKSQGLTLDAVLADLGHLAAMDNLAYVALSRCRRLSDVFLLRLHPGIFRTDERCVSCLNEHRRLAGLPEQDECNASSLRFPGARQLVYGRRRRTTIAVSKVYAHHPDAAASNRSSSIRGRDNIGHQGRGRGRGRVFASTQSRVQSRNQNRGQSRGTSRGRSSRGRSGPSEGQVGVPAPRPTRPFLPPLPSHLQADGDWLVTTFSRPNSFRLQQEEFLPFVTSLQDAIALPTSPPRLQRVTAWLRTLPIATLDSLGPATPPEDALAPTTFLYSCLHPLLRSISTNANGDCQFNSIWGSVCGTSSTWHARLLRGALVATICLHWDHFLALQALANDTTSQEYVEYFSRDIVAAVSAQSYVEDSLLYPLSYLLAREIHLYQRCERTGLNGVPSPAPVTPTLPELAAALTDRSLMKIIRFSSLPFPPTRRPILTLFNGLNHYATLLPRSLVLESQLPQPVLYLNDIPTIALFQAAHPLPPPDWDSLLLPQAPVPLLPAPPGAQQVPHRPPPATPSGPLPNLGPPPPIYTWPTWSQLYSVPKSTRPQRPVDLQLNNRLFLCTGDLRTLPVDAIVNAANTTLAGGGGIDGLIHTAAGPQLLKACLALRGCKTGQSKSTRGFRLPATHVIHTVGPDCRNMSLAGATSLLSSAYESALDEALRLKATTIAIPCISIGIYGFPGPQAADVAVSTVRRFLHTKAANVKLDVILCLYSATDEANYKAVLPLHFPIP